MADTHSTAYAPAHRLLHWLTALLIFGLVPVGIIMSNRGAAGLWDALTNQLYAWHKLIGFIVLLLVLARLIVRVVKGAPAYPSGMPKWMVGAAHGLHALMYVLLFAVPLAGWAGVTAFPATITVGGFHLPAMPFVPQSEELARTFFRAHMAGAILLTLMVVGHVGAALFHLIVKKDGVFQRMWPKRAQARA
jgi:cytochrome b561